MLKSSMLIAVALSLAPASAPSEQLVQTLLWQNVRLGMTPDELRNARPAVVAYKDGFVERSILVAGEAFDAYFILTNGAVTEVNLEASSTIVSSIADALSLKYGQANSPLKCEQVAIATMCTASWRSPEGAAIKLRNITGPGLTPLLSISFAAMDTAGI